MTVCVFYAWITSFSVMYLCGSLFCFTSAITQFLELLLKEMKKGDKGNQEWYKGWRCKINHSLFNLSVHFPVVVVKLTFNFLTSYYYILLFHCMSSLYYSISVHRQHIKPKCLLIIRLEFLNISLFSDSLLPAEYF
jgi:hypothetical protein